MARKLRVRARKGDCCNGEVLTDDRVWVERHRAVELNDTWAGYLHVYAAAEVGDDLESFSVTKSD